LSPHVSTEANIFKSAEFLTAIQQTSFPHEMCAFIRIVKISVSIVDKLVRVFLQNVSVLEWNARIVPLCGLLPLPLISFTVYRKYQPKVTEWQFLTLNKIQDLHGLNIKLDVSYP
jgi:hypothetical protein